jgi:hypothetical protein
MFRRRIEGVISVVRTVLDNECMPVQVFRSFYYTLNYETNRILFLPFLPFRGHLLILYRLEMRLEPPSFSAGASVIFCFLRRGSLLSSTTTTCAENISRSCNA